MNMAKVVVSSLNGNDYLCLGLLLISLRILTFSVGKSV
jgi:hypothetical protein